MFDYFSHSCPKMCKICLERTLDASFLDCLALTSCDVIGELLPELACLTLQGGTNTVDGLIFVGYQFSWFSWRVPPTNSSANDIAIFCMNYEGKY